MLSCREISRLVSEQIDRKLPLRRRIEMRLHFMMCRACSLYARQIRQLDRLLKQRLAGWRPVEDDPWDCPPDAKERITRGLENRQ